MTEHARDRLLTVYAENLSTASRYSSTHGLRRKWLPESLAGVGDDLIGKPRSHKSGYQLRRISRRTYADSPARFLQQTKNLGAGTAIVDDLTYSLKQLYNRHRDCTEQNRTARYQSLHLFALQLNELGFRHMRATSLKGKHIDALLQHWKRQRIAWGTVRNRLTHLRWWARKIGKSGLMPASNEHLIVFFQDGHASDQTICDRVRDALSGISDPYVSIGIRLQTEFALTRTEAIKFAPCSSDRGDHIVLAGSAGRSKRERIVPITTVAQRALLDEARQLAGTGTLIPTHFSYSQQRRLYDRFCRAAGISNLSALRRLYAQDRYETITGWKSPKAGGEPSHALKPEQCDADAIARRLIAAEWAAPTSRK